MSDVGWGSDHLEPPKQEKSGIPGWLIGCAGGCMFLVGASAVALYFAGRYLQGWLEENNDPKVQWPALAEVLPHEAPPAGFEIARLPIPMLDLWRLSSPNEDAVVFIGAGGASGGGGPGGEILDQWYRVPDSAPVFGEVRGSMETVVGKITLQGRELDCLRLQRGRASESLDPSQPEKLTPPAAPGEPEAPAVPEAPKVPGAETDAGKLPAPGAREVPKPPGSGASEEELPDWLRSMAAIHEDPARGNGIVIDVTSEGGETRVIAWIVRRTPGETVSDEDAARLLAPFVIGPVR